MTVTHTYTTWQQIIDTIRNRRMNFSQGHHERMAEVFADQLEDEVEAQIEDQLVSLNFGDDWDSYMVVAQAAARL